MTPREHLLSIKKLIQYQLTVIDCIIHYLRGSRSEQSSVPCVTGVDRGRLGHVRRDDDGEEEEGPLEGEAGVDEGRRLGSVVDEERLGAVQEYPVNMITVNMKISVFIDKVIPGQND